MSQASKIKSWSMDESAPTDLQQAETKQQQANASAIAQFGDALAKEARANQDRQIEGEQLGKNPWSRWYSGSQNQAGFNLDKGIADMLFLSLFGHSSASDTKRTRTQRAIIRVALTIGVIIALGLLWEWLTYDSTHQTHNLFR